MQRCANFIEDQYARHERRVWKMSGQAGMIGGNRAGHFKGHVSEVSSCQQLQQLNQHSYKTAA
jgi:hypothetical protein